MLRNKMLGAMAAATLIVGAPAIGKTNPRVGGAAMLPTARTTPSCDTTRGCGPCGAVGWAMFGCSGTCCAVAVTGGAGWASCFRYIAATKA